MLEVFRFECLITKSQTHEEVKVYLERSLERMCGIIEECGDLGGGLDVYKSVIMRCVKRKFSMASDHEIGDNKMEMGKLLGDITKWEFDRSLIIAGKAQILSAASKCRHYWK